MSGITYKITGRGEKGGPAKKMLIFTTHIKVDGADPKGSKKEELEVHIEGPETGIKPTIMGSDGTFHIGFTPMEPGQYWADFVFRGKWADDPFMIPVKDMTNKCPDHPYVGVARKAGGGSSAAPKPAAATPAPKPAVAATPAPKPSGPSEADKKKEEDAKKQREAEEKKKAEEEKKQKEEAERKQKEEAEKKKRDAEEAENKKKAADEAEKKKRDAEEAEKKKRDAEEAENKKKAADEAEKKKRDAEEAENKKKAADEAEKKKREAEEKKKADEAAAEKKRKEEADKKKHEEEEAKKKADADKKKKEDEEQAKKAAAEDTDKKRANDEADRKKRREEEEKKKDEERERLELERKEKHKRAQERSAARKKQKEISDSGPARVSVTSVSVRFRAVNRNGESKLEGGDAGEFKAVANGQEITKIEDMGEGLYSFDCTPIPGKNSIDVQYKGKSVKGFPLVFTRKTEAELQADREEFERLAKEEEEKSLEEEKAESEKAENEKAEAAKKAVEAAKKPEPAKPVEPVKKSEPAKPVEPVKKPEPVKPAEEPKKAAEPAKPVGAPTVTLTEAERKIQELEERKKALAAKRAELASKRKDVEGTQPAAPVTPVKAEEPAKPKVEVPATVSASKLTATWQNRAQGKDAEEPKPAETRPRGPSGGKSAIAQRWLQGAQKKEEPKPAETPATATPPKRAPSKIASMWEQKATAEPEAPTKAKSEIEDLKRAMTAERMNASGGVAAATTGSGDFTNDPAEIAVLLYFLNQALKKEKNAKGIPLSPDNPDKLFKELSDGINICYWLGIIAPEQMDIRVITRKINDKRDKVDNWNLCVNTAKALGCRLNDVKADALADGDAVQIQKVMWEIIRVNQESQIRKLDAYWDQVVPSLSKEEIKKSPADKLILAWVNQLMKNRGESRTAKSLTTDFKDCWFFIELCDEVMATGKDLYEEEEALLKAEGVLMFSEELGGPFATAEGIVGGVYWQNYILLSTLLINAAALL